MKKEIIKWELLESEYVLTTKWFKIRKDKVRLPNGKIYTEYYVRERPDWVLIFCLTEDAQLILLRTYKHGSQCFVYELPSGSIEADENPHEAVLRELKEETGFTVDRADLFKVGSVLVDPVYTQAHLHIFVGIKAKKIKTVEYNPLEMFEIHFIPPVSVLDVIRGNMGAFPDSQIAGIFLALDFIEREKLG